MNRKGLTLIEVLVLIVVTALLLGVLTPGLNMSRQTAVRLVCRTSLTGIGRAIAVYANENEGRFPRAGGPGGTWIDEGVIPDYRGGFTQDEDGAFNIIRDHTGQIIVPGRATITSSFYYLIKFGQVPPRQFICKGDEGAQEFDLSPFPPYSWDLKKFFDFGPGPPCCPLPGEHVSYSYHLPYSRAPDDIRSFMIVDISRPTSPVCADRNPHLDKNVLEGGVSTNSAAHQGKGQNVLYRDGSVRFERQVTVGIAGDNIYTYGGDPWLGGGDPNGTPPAGNGNGFPLGEKDAYLVGEQNY